jgi:hypothetical protein
MSLARLNVALDDLAPGATLRMARDDSDPCILPRKQAKETP